MVGRERSAGLWVCAALCVAATSVSPAANLTRQYDFEEGVPGSPAAFVIDSIDDLVFSPVPSNPTFAWIEVPGNAPRPLPRTSLPLAVDSTARSAPALNVVAGAVGFINVGPGSEHEHGLSRAPSDVALWLDGETVLNDFESDAGEEGTGYGGTRGVFYARPEFDRGAPVLPDLNTFESRSLLTQAWVWPSGEAQGTRQIVYQIGAQHGAVTISENGFWGVDRLGDAGPIVSDAPVRFDEWNHVAVLRNAGEAELFVNGEMVGSEVGGFDTYASLITLGGGLANEERFTGLVDNFLVSGFGDVTFDTTEDLDIRAACSPTCGCDPSPIDYDVWSRNLGFDNGLGVGDPSTFLRGDVDANGRVDFFDFALISAHERASGAGLTAPEPRGSVLAGLLLPALLLSPRIAR